MPFDSTDFPPRTDLDRLVMRRLLNWPQHYEYAILIAKKWIELDAYIKKSNNQWFYDTGNGKIIEFLLEENISFKIAYNRQTTYTPSFLEYNLFNGYDIIHMKLKINLPQDEVILKTIELHDLVMVN